MAKKILLIDDDNDLLNLVSLLFKKNGAEVITARDGHEGISKLFTHHLDLIVLDVNMPGLNGFDVCQRIRQVSDIPLIMLTALNHEKDMLMGLEAGADDFLSKPFNTDILLARVDAILRRSHQVNSSLQKFAYNDGHLSIDIEKHQVQINGKKIKLTPLEFSLLVYLARNAGKVLTFKQILASVWGNGYQGNVDYVHVYISHLRRKLEGKVEGSNYIVTVHGVGYFFEKQELEYEL